jgi:hypothetical protein
MAESLFAIGERGIAKVPAKAIFPSSVLCFAILQYLQRHLNLALLSLLILKMDRDKPSAAYFTPGSLGLLTTRLGGPLLQFKLLRNGHIARFMQSTLGISQKSILGPALLAVPGISRFSLGGLNEVASLLIAMYGIAGLRQVSTSAFTSVSCSVVLLVLSLMACRRTGRFSHAHTISTLMEPSPLAQ